MNNQQNKSNSYLDGWLFLACLVQVYNYCIGIRLNQLTKSSSEAKPHKKAFTGITKWSLNITVWSLNIIIVLLYLIYHYSYIHGPTQQEAF